MKQKKAKTSSEREQRFLTLEEARELEKLHLFPLFLKSRFPFVAVRGEGCYLWDAEGRRYLDFTSGGRAAAILGHCPSAVAEAVANQARTLLHVTGDFYAAPQLMLAKQLTEISGFDRAFICNSGTEANEAAIKLARKYAKSISAAKTEIITFEGSFHGRTYGALSATGQRNYQKGFEPLVPGFTHIPFNDEAALQRAASDSTCAVMLEPVLGESGVFPASEGFIRTTREVCDRRGALLIFDEVQTGLGRTGRLFAFEHFGVKPDVLTLAKGLGTGFPVAAMLARGRAAEAFAPGDHGTTFGGGPLACAAALACVQEIEKRELVDRARSLGELMMSRLRSIAAQVPAISQVRGLGLMVGVDTDGPRAAELRRACLERGLLIAGSTERTVRLLPPLVISEQDLERGLEAFRLAAEEI